ncbi:MAG: hypothetical protein P8M26_01020 [Gammaproteobacteria bacterium]|nr:hypothetical protein [Gammaproteobacteria bacterium]
MTNFWLVGAALIVVALVFIGVPLLRGRGEKAVTLSMIVLLLGLPVVVVSLYLALSTQDWDAATQAQQPAAISTPEDMIAQLEERTSNGSGTLEEWLMLGRSYATMQRFPDAVRAYSEAWNKSNNTSVEAALGLGEALTYINRDALQGDAGTLVEWVLEQEPENARALWFGGLVSLSRGLDQQAADRWTRLLRFEMPDELRGVIQQQLAVLPPSEDLLENPDQSSTEVFIDVSVNVADALTAQAAGANTLYVFVREPGKAGPPLAVKRLAPSFPVSVQLTDANTMIPGSTLADKPVLSISARLSMSGDPIAASGDLEGTAEWQAVNNGAVALTIDRVRD